MARDGVDRVRDVVWVDIVRNRAVTGVGMVSDMAEAGMALARVVAGEIMPGIWMWLGVLRPGMGGGWMGLV